MSKTLTEQWREGTLPQGNYYIVIRGITEKQIMIDYYIPELHHFEIKPSECILEVLAPVPSYEKVKEMSQKIERLEFDNEALEMAHNEGKEINAELVSKNEQLEKQLDIAFKVLHKFAFDYDDTTKPRVFIENSLVALGDMREVE